MNIAVIAGGNSGERKVSLKSQENVLAHLQSSEYTLFRLVLTGSQIVYLDSTQNTTSIDLNDFSLILKKTKVKFDFVINLIHGTPGENGFLQGYLELLNIPYNTSDVLVSGLTFNKQVCKYVLEKLANVKMASSKIIRGSSKEVINELELSIEYPMFVKPNKGGSSVGISKVKNKEELAGAIQIALNEDDEVLVEEYIQGREVTCGVYSKNSNPEALSVTEIEFQSEFFDYEAKYNSTSTKEITPARISEKLYNHCIKISKEVYSFLKCKGVVRIDYIIKNEELYLIEVNTIPGMSEQSIIPKQLEYTNTNMFNLFKDELLSVLV